MSRPEFLIRMRPHSSYALKVGKSSASKAKKVFMRCILLVLVELSHPLSCFPWSKDATCNKVEGQCPQRMVNFLVSIWLD